MNYYNEFDPRAAAWLRELINQGHIAAGIVDERSIADVRPGDLAGFTQHHFFAGIGVWSYALRRAGWPDARRVWTGSCPCQPFSNAGQGNGFADERHLWPFWFQLIAQCQPATVFGEQVASKDGLKWFDLVHADLEAAGYAVGAADLCAAGVGAPHIRQRLWFVADSDGGDAGTEREQRGGQQRLVAPDGRTGWLADSSSTGLEGCDAGALGRERTTAERGGGAGELADPALQRRAGDERPQPGVSEGGHLAVGNGMPADPRPGPTNGHWRAADWIACRDGRWRAVEPGSFPLAYGAAARVGRLRGYGNAVVAQAAHAFIESTGLI